MVLLILFKYGKNVLRGDAPAWPRRVKKINVREEGGWSKLSRPLSETNDEIGSPWALGSRQNLVAQCYSSESDWMAATLGRSSCLYLAIVTGSVAPVSDLVFRGLSARVMQQRNRSIMASNRMRSA